MTPPGLPPGAEPAGRVFVAVLAYLLVISGLAGAVCVLAYLRGYPLGVAAGVAVWLAAVSSLRERPRP